MSQDKAILTLLVQGTSQRQIAARLHVSRNTVAKVARAVKQYSLHPEAMLALSEEAVHAQLFPGEQASPQPALPDFTHIHKELLRNGVTLKLLWEEYADQYRGSSMPYLRYSQFCKRYSDFVEANNLTMHIRHKPGDRIMVDWAGTKMHLGNPALIITAVVYRPFRKNETANLLKWYRRFVEKWYRKACRSGHAGAAMGAWRFPLT